MSTVQWELKDLFENTPALRDKFRTVQVAQLEKYTFFIDQYSHGQYKGNTTPPQPLCWNKDAVLLAPLPHNETERVDHVSYIRPTTQLVGDMQTKHAEVLQQLKDLVHCDIVALNLIDHDHLYVQCSLGWSEKVLNRQLTFCSHTLEHGDYLLVADATKDWRFKNHPVVKQGILKFYLGFTMGVSFDLLDDTEAFNIGTLCFANPQSIAFDNSLIPLLRHVAQSFALEYEAAIIRQRIKEQNIMEATLAQFTNLLIIPQEASDDQVRDLVFSKAIKEISTCLLDSNVEIVQRQIEKSDLVIVPTHKICKPFKVLTQDGRSLDFVITSTPTRPSHVYDRFDNNFALNFSTVISSAIRNHNDRTISNAKSVFLRDIANEMRNPLHAILGFADLFLLSEDKDETIVQTIRASAQHLVTVVQNMIAFESLEGELQPTFLTEVNLWDVVEQSMEGYAQHIVPHMEVKIEYSTPGPVLLLTGVSQIRQIVDNLIGNAFKFANVSYGKYNKDKPIRITVTISESGLYFSDNGCGMSSTFVKDRLYHPYNKENSETSGIGIGLTLVKRFCKQMDLDLELITSVPYEETIFCLRNSDTNSSFWQIDKRPLSHTIDTLKWHVVGTESFYTNLVIHQLTPLVCQKRKDDRKPITMYLVDLDASPHVTITTDNRVVLVLTHAVSVKYPPRHGNIFTLFKPINVYKIAQTMLEMQNRYSTLNFESQQWLGSKYRNKAIRALVVDDNVVNRNILFSFLRKKRIPCETATNGLEALELYKQSILDSQQSPFNFVLSDIQMPLCDGIKEVEAIRKFEADQGCAPAYIVLMTGVSGDTSRQTCFEKGASAYFMKPMTLDDVSNILVYLTSQNE